MGDTEDRLLQDDKERIELDRQKWIIERKRQRAHFGLLKLRMKLLNKGTGDAEEIWKDNIEPNLNKE
jgi:hypothetical protein